MATSGDKDFLAKKIVSSDGPKGGEIVHDAALREWCLTRIEPEEESNRRISVLERIVNLVRVWIRHTMITEFRMPEASAAQVEGRIFTTGSFRYNVHTSGSDIDMVLVAPSLVTRDHFFDTLAPRLKSEPWVSDLHCIRESRVPIIAMVCDGVDIDLSFVSIRQDRVPEVITDDLLQGLDEQSVLSCNAVRVAHNIMDLVPNKAVFRQALRFVKAWGKQRAIYSNTFGFPSGIGWAILTAFVCQCYPNQNAAGMVTRFFRTYHTWFKPNPHETGTENRAIYLTESMRARSTLGRGWDPRESKSDAKALFPVLTPAVPYGNACYNVTLTNLRQLCDEFQRGHELLSQSLGLSAAEAKARFGPFGVWSAVLEPAPFFGKYQYYLHIKVSCSDAAHYQAYADGVESRMRFLWAGNAKSRGHTLEDYQQLRLHLNPRRFEDPEEMELRARLTSKAAAGTGATGRGSVGTRASGQLGNDSHSASLRGSLSMKDGAGAATGPTSFTAHYFIGMTVDTKVSSAKIDLVPAIKTFHADIRELRQYRDGVTKLPEISLVDMARIPAFVKEAAGYTEGEDAAEADAREKVASGSDGHGSAASAPTNGHGAATVYNGASATTTTANTTATSATAAHSSNSGSAASAATQSVAGEGQTCTTARDANSGVVSGEEGASRKREREEGDEVNGKRSVADEKGVAGSAKTEALGSAVGANGAKASSAAAAAAANDDDDDDLERALGLDF